MQQTTRTTTHNSKGPLADAGPYTYDLPVAQGGGQPLPVPQPRPVRKAFDWSWAVTILFVSFFAQPLHDWSGWRLIACYMLLCGTGSILSYWSKPKPRPSFLPWALKVVGIWLNCYIGLVTVPLSLGGLLPAPLAFGLPAFVVVLALYLVLPLRPDTGKKMPLWQWLLWSLAAAVCWGLLAPGISWI